VPRTLLSQDGILSRLAAEVRPVQDRSFASFPFGLTSDRWQHRERAYREIRDCLLESAKCLFLAVGGTRLFPRPLWVGRSRPAGYRRNRRWVLSTSLLAFEGCPRSRG